MLSADSLNKVNAQSVVRDHRLTFGARAIFLGITEEPHLLDQDSVMLAYALMERGGGDDDTAQILEAIHELVEHGYLTEVPETHEQRQARELREERKRYEEGEALAGLLVDLAQTSVSPPPATFAAHVMAKALSQRGLLGEWQA